MKKSVLICGQAGQGVQTVGYLLAKTMLRDGFDVFAWQDFQSRIRGGESSFRIVFSDSNDIGLPAAYDIIVSLDKKNSDVYRPFLSENGAFICAPGAETAGATAIDIGAVSSDSSKKKFINTAMASAAAAAAGLSADAFEKLLAEEFAAKGSGTVSSNVEAARAGLSAASKIFRPADKNLDARRKTSGGGKKLLMSGNEALALGAIAGGCRFIAAYPMTPSTGIITYLAATSKRTGITAIQSEDEIAAVNMAVGASYAGARAMTATSGGGFALMTEGISLAAMTELPLVVVLAQRPGPATGLPTRTEQGELLFALHCSHGEFPRFILAPSDAASAVRLMRDAFELSQKYRVPAIVLSDQYLADSYWTIPADGPTFPASVPRDITDAAGYKTYALSPDGVSPQLPIGTPGASVICDSDEHDENGNLTEDLNLRKKMVEKRWRKYPAMEKEFAAPPISGDKTAGIILVGWGTSGTIAEKTSRILAGQGRKTAFVKYENIWPLAAPPEFLDGKHEIIVIENNYTGQFARLLSERGVTVSQKINRFDGLPFIPEEVAGQIMTSGKNRL